MGNILEQNSDLDGVMLYNKLYLNPHLFVLFGINAKISSNSPTIAARVPVQETLFLEPGKHKRSFSHHARATFLRSRVFGTLNNPSHTLGTWIRKCFRGVQIWLFRSYGVVSSYPLPVHRLFHATSMLKTCGLLPAMLKVIARKPTMIFSKAKEI
jgi:hypothetical protein